MRSAAEDGGGGAVVVVVVLTVATQMNWCLKRKSSGFKAPPIAGFITSVNSSPMSLWPRPLVQASFNAAGPLGVRVLRAAVALSPFFFFFPLTSN